MAIRLKKKVKHNGIWYPCASVITEITKEEAERLESIGACEIIDNKFIDEKKKLKDKIIRAKARNKGKAQYYES